MVKLPAEEKNLPRTSPKGRVLRPLLSTYPILEASAFLPKMPKIDAYEVILQRDTLS